MIRSLNAQLTPRPLRACRRGLVILNLVLMCMGYAGMSAEYAARLELAGC